MKNTTPGIARHWIWDVLLLNLVVRFAWIWVMHPKQEADFLWYFDRATELAQNQGYNWMGHPTAYWPIGWPLFLSVIYRITGPSVVVGLVVNILLSTVIVGLVYATTMKLFNRRSYALAAAVLYSLLPSQIEWNAILGSEELFSALLILSVYLYISSETAQRWFVWIVAAGFILGFASDVRPIPLLFPVFVLAYEWFVKRRRLQVSFYRAASLALGMFLMILPVTIRNKITMHHFVLVSSNGGTNLFQGIHTNGGYWWSWSPYANPLLHINNEIVKNEVGEHVALQYIEHHIPKTILNGFIKIFDLYKADVNSVWYTFRVEPNLAHLVPRVDAVTTTGYFLFMMAVAIGLGVVWVRQLPGWKNAMMPFSFIVYNTCFFFFFPAWDRFRYPLMPLFAIFGGVGIVIAWRAMKSREESDEATE